MEYTYLFSRHFYFMELCFSAKYLPRCMDTDKAQSLALILKHEVVKNMYFNIIEQNTVIKFQNVRFN